MNNTYEDYCRIIGDLYLNAHNQQKQILGLVEQLKKEVASLQKENKQLKEGCPTCNIQKENI